MFPGSFKHGSVRCPSKGVPASTTGTGQPESPTPVTPKPEAPAEPQPEFPAPIPNRLGHLRVDSVQFTKPSSVSCSPACLRSTIHFSPGKATIMNISDVRTRIEGSEKGSLVTRIAELDEAPVLTLVD